MMLSDLSIRRRVFAWMLMSALIIFGGISFMRMGVSQLPDVDFPVVTVSLSLLGAAPEVMETQVVDPVEDAVMSVQGVRTVTSSAQEGQATVTIEFELNRDIDVALQEVQTKVTQAQQLLPREIDPPVIVKTNPEDQPIVWLGLSSDQHSERDLMVYLRDELKDRFSTVPGVGELLLGGYIEPNMRIWVSEERLKKYYLTVNDVISAIQKEHLEPPSGYIAQGKKEANVRTFGEAQTVEQFKKLAINNRGGEPNYSPIFLSQVADVQAGLADIRRIARTNGKPAVGLGVRKQRGSNSVAVARATKQRAEEVQKTLPPGYNLRVVFDSTRFIEESIQELNITLALSALLTALVCWLFLGSWSSTLNVVLAIPTSIIGSFIVLYFSGFTLNTFTLLGLSLAIGIVVDDAIMVLENIVRHREGGEDRTLGALHGAREVTFAATAASIAIVAIFLPVAFMTGIIGKFFFQFGVTLTVAVLLSLVEALTLTPMRAATFLRVGKRTTRLGCAVETAFEKSRQFYRKALPVVLNHRKTVVALALLFFALSFLTVNFLNKEFSPAQDESLFLVQLKTPVGSSLEYTNAKFRLVEDFLSKRPEMAGYFCIIGGFHGGEINTGIMFATMKQPGERGKDPKSGKQLTQQEFMDLTREELAKIPDATITLQDLSMRGFTASRGFPVEFVLTGPDWEKLASLSTVLQKELTKTGLVTDLDSDYEAGKPEIRITPDRTKAASRGVEVAAIGQVISALVGGQVVGQYSDAGHRYDIRVRLKLDELKPDQLQKFNVRNNRKELIPLSEVVNIEEKPSLQVISRKDRQRAITLFGNVAPGKSQADALTAVDQTAKRVLPANYSVALTGSAQTFKESFSSLIFVLLLGILVSYMVLATQFNSFIDPFTVLMALPFSVSGAFLSLLLGRQSLNIYSLIGLILLMGIVKKNSILLVDFTNQIRGRENLSTHDSLIKACPIRLRPILMTSIATIAGAIPPALALGPGAETRVPMAIAVIGGIIVSTALTLFVVPCVYSLLDRLKWSR